MEGPRECEARNTTPPSMSYTEHSGQRRTFGGLLAVLSRDDAAHFFTPGWASRTNNTPRSEHAICGNDLRILRNCRPNISGRSL